MLVISSRSSGRKDRGLLQRRAELDRAAGRSSSISGLVVCAKRSTRSIVCLVATLNAGNARIVLASAVSCAAVAANTALEFRMKPWS